MDGSLFPNLTANALSGPFSVGVGVSVLFLMFVIGEGTSTPRKECYKPLINLHVFLGEHLLVDEGSQRISRPYTILVSVVPW